MIKMIVTDLDGTLLNEEKKITETTKNYLNELKRKGYILVIASGRTYSSILNITENAEFAKYIITDNGTCIYDKETNESLLYHKLTKDSISKIIEFYNKDFKYIDFCAEKKGYKLLSLSDYNESLETIKENTRKEASKIEVTHVAIAMKDNNLVKAIYQKLKNALPELDISLMQDSFTNKMTLEILTKNCSKKNAIKHLSKILKIEKNNIIVFGDGLNDIEMIEKCGYGVALKNALPEVKKVAKDITTYDYKEDGVIKYLKEKLDKIESR